MTPIYVLYCSEFPERENGCREHLAAQGVQAHYWRGFAGKVWGFDTRLEYEPGQRISPGHVGLNAGSWAMWQHAYHQTDHDDQAIVFLEDDCVVSHIFPAELSDLQIQLNYDMPDWDLVFLGLAECEPHVWHKVTERVGGPNSRLCRLNDPFGTHALMMRRRAIPVLLDHMTAAERNLDQQLFARVLKPGLLKWCAVLPSLVTQRTFDYAGTGKPEWKASTIDDGPQPPSNMLRFVPAALHELKTLHDDHHEEQQNALPPAELIEASTALIDPFPCIYRGEFLDEMVRGLDGRSAPLSLCGRLNEACYSKRGLVAEDARSCEQCDLRIEMASDRTSGRLPVPEGHFNPSMCMYKGQLILATRDSWGHSKVALWRLHNANQDWSGEWRVDPIASLASSHQEAPRLEDPRLFMHNGRLHSVFNLPDGYPPKQVRVGYCRFSEDLQVIEETVVFPSPYGSAYEKNWVPLSVDGQLRWVYATKPKHVILHDEGGWETVNNLPWTGGFMRGGAVPVFKTQLAMNGQPPVLFDSPVYYHFFHGCLKRLQGNVYTMGCVVFDAKPPYKVLRQTVTPLLWPDQPAHGESVVKRYVCWPGGAVPHAGRWHIVTGVDDTFCRMVSFPFEQVESALKDTPVSDTTVSIRNTAMATEGRRYS